MKIAVAGTGYVGLVTGVVLAHIGHNVTCVDVNQEKINLLNTGISPIFENDLENLMHENKNKLNYTTDYNLAYRDADVIFIGVGTPENILEAVERGVDFFDCVLPARNGRHAHVYTNFGKLNLLNAKFEKDDTPIDETCGCPACRKYTKAYIRHLFKAKEMLAMRLCVLHNLYFFNSLMEEIRQAIEEDRFHEYKKQKLEDFKRASGK